MKEKLLTLTFTLAIYEAHHQRYVVYWKRNRSK